MAVTSDAFNATDLAARINENWPSMIMEELFPKAVFANHFTDMSSMMTEGDIANVPDIYTNKFTGQTQSTQGAEITTEAELQVNVQLNVNTHRYIAFIIGDKDAKQLLRSFDFNEVYTRKAAGTLINLFEQDMAALWSGLSTNSVGDTATVLTDLEIRSAHSALDNLNFDLDECGWIVHPVVFWKQIAGIAKFYDATVRGQKLGSFTVNKELGGSNPSRGVKGRLYDSVLYTTTNVVNGFQTYRNIFAHPSALGYAFQIPSVNNGGGEMVRAQSEYELRNLGMLTVVDMLYGVVELRDEAAVVVNANTTSTTS